MSSYSQEHTLWGGGPKSCSVHFRDIKSPTLEKQVGRLQPNGLGSNVCKLPLSTKEISPSCHEIPFGHGSKRTPSLILAFHHNIMK